ncbi:DNA cytosine methyltransferase [Marinobacterium lutimaris]|uniref:DNA (cytosine-5-)-methyltransferase n=1 Tax=Marinobacterium lutimaris TaxID=568106 RepID=A0A1H5XY55_9GAMM|nr:DNA cytosine methyltransferase [Marinobacterium lutimaris]SEG16216.1 DNA (cytosine-5)-methyltransferase 1 [Marinobacterium lutimaris]
MNLFREIIVDNFAGGGGTSTGIYQATGRHVDIAINHDPDAIAMHAMNHPHTRHYCESVWEVDPREAVQGMPVALCWLSPDCKHFSKAKGGKPVSKEIRGLAWVAVRWAATVKPRVIMLENVEEFQTWGPILKDGKPCPRNKGREFRAFINALKRQGYQVDWKELRACDYGAPTIRKRLFLIARRDGQPITWPAPTHGDPNSPAVKRGKLLPWRTAAECIDWSIPAPSIFERTRPLAENTLRRIARGLQRFVIDNPEPFIVPLRGTSQHHTSTHETRAPLSAISAGGTHHALVTPFITEHANASSQRNMAADEPLRTQCASVKGGHFAMVAPTLIQTGYGERKTKYRCNHCQTVFDLEPTCGCTVCGAEDDLAKLPAQKPRSLDIHNPLGTIVAGGSKHALITSFLAKHYGGNYTGPGTDLRNPMSTVTVRDHHALVQAFLIKYYGNDKDGLQLREPLHTIPTRDRFGLVTIHGTDYQIVDIGMRMLQPRELFTAQGFPLDYIIDRDAEGNTITKTKQVARCGNAVPPQFSEALVRANLPELCTEPMETAA